MILLDVMETLLDGALEFLTRRRWRAFILLALIAAGVLWWVLR